MQFLIRIKIVIIVFFFLSCTSPIDYFGNDIDLKSDRIYLSKMREDKNNREKYTLIFIEQRGNHSKLTNKKRNRTLNKYLDLIKSYYGYTSYKVHSRKQKGIIAPRYYVVVEFDWNDTCWDELENISFGATSGCISCICLLH